METKMPEPKRVENTKKQGGAKKNTTLITFLVLSLLVNAALVIAVILLYNQANDQKSQISALTGEVTTKDAEVTAKTQELTNLKADLDRIKEERMKLGLANDSLDLQIANLNASIDQLKRTAHLDASKRRALNKLISALREQVLEKDQQISYLKSANDSLSSGITSLSREKQLLGDSLANTANALALASVLKAQGLEVSALKENGKEFDDEVLKGSKIDRLKVSFSLADNKAARQNTKIFYVALTTPKGEVFSDPNNGGGVIALTDGEEVLYTMSQPLDFDNSNQRLTFTMLKGFNYQPGKYKINIFSEGYEIGKGSFQVK